MTKQALLSIVHADRKAYIAEVGEREYECLEALVRDGTLDTVQKLAEHGVTIPNNAS